MTHVIQYHGTFLPLLLPCSILARACLAGGDGGGKGLLTDKGLFCGCLGKVWFEIKFSYFATSGTAIICDDRVARKLLVTR